MLWGKRSQQLCVAYQELESKEANLRELSAQAILLQEKERRSIARELHDGVGQALTAIRINLQVLSVQGEKNNQGDKLIDKTLGLVDEALEEVRRAVGFLGPAILDEISLKKAIERQGDDFMERTGIPIQVEIDAKLRRLPSAIESTCYRIVLEALNNVTKHASAQSAKLTLVIARSKLRLDIHDDGCGLPVEGNHSAPRRLKVTEVGSWKSWVFTILPVWCATLSGLDWFPQKNEVVPCSARTCGENREFPSTKRVETPLT